MKKVLSLLLSICMVVAMVSGTMVIVEAEDYSGVWEHRFNPEYSEFVTWSYDSESKTLTLAGEKITINWDTDSPEWNTYLPQDMKSCFLECETLVLCDFTSESIDFDAVETLFPNLKHLHYSETYTAEVSELKEAPTLEKITVDDNHPLYVSIDGVLYNHDMECIKYPNGKKDKEYTVPENVTYFSADAPCLEVLNVPEGVGEVEISSGYGIINVYSMEAIPYGRVYGYKGSRAHERALFYVDEDGYTYFREFNNALDKNGTYGDNITWSFDNVKKTLTISGDGPIKGADSKTGGRPAWGIFCWDIECVYIESGITEIGFDTVENLPEAKVICIPKTVERIDGYYFGELTDIYYEGSKSEWNEIELGIYVDDSFDDVTIHYNHEMNPSKDFEDISFVSTIFAYDGEEKTIEIEGELPDGATVTYTNNTATDAGTYRATAVIEAEGYNTLTLSANLVINKATITVKADDVSMIKGGEMPELTYTVEGELFGGDEITGALSTKANGSKTGKFDITKGTLTAGNNYAITFVKGTLTVGDKLEQNIVVDEIGEKTYGDEAFVIAVTADENANLTDFTFESSNTNVAEVGEDGTVTIKAAGTTKITVTQPGNETYAAFKKTQTLTVNRAALTVKADDVFMIKGGEMPELTYTVEGELFGDDVITGALSTKANGSKTGKFDITQGTIKANSNYKLTFEKGTLTVSDKKMQNVVVGEIGEKTYGDEPFVIAITADENANLTDFAFESSNTNVAEVDEDGTVTIKGAGETDITITVAGNETYAEFETIKTLVVNKRAVTIQSIDLNNKVAVLSGLAEGDEVTVDLESIALEAEATESDVIEAVVKNFTLLGTDAENYALETESVTSEVSKENVVWVNVSTETGTIEGEGVYLKGNKATVTAKPLSKYTFTGWYVGDELVSKDATYTFDATEDVSLVAQFKKKTSGGGGGSSVSYYTVKFDTNGGNEIAKQDIAKNSNATIPAEPIKEGFVFKGWFADEKLTVVYDFATKVTKNVTLYAAWEEVDNSTNEIVLVVDSKTAVVFGEEVTNDVAPIIRNDRTMLPARFVAEKLGAKVEWNNEKRQVKIVGENVEILITIDSDTAYVNGKEVKLDSAAFIENERTYTPIRFIAENLGAKVEWNGETNQVTITK